MDLLKKCLAALFFGCILHATLAQDNAPPPLKECADAFSIGASPTELKCKEDAKFALSSTAAVVTSAKYTSGASYFDITLSPALTFTAASQCPVKLKPTELSCSKVLISLATTNTGTVGTFLTIDGESGFGMVKWDCTAESVNFGFFFFIDGVANDDEADFTTAGATFLATALDAPNTAQTSSASDLDVMKLQKFAGVSASTDIYFVKNAYTDPGTGSPVTENLFIFKSPETAVKLSTNLYDTIKGSNSIGQYVASAECADAYMLKFSGSDGAGKSGLFIVAVWIAGKTVQI